MKILITGGAGFIGSHLVEKLLKENCQVMVLDNLHTGLKENLPEGVSFIEMDVRDENILTVFAKEKFEAIVHLAGQTMVNVSVDDPKFDAAVNIQGTINVLEAARKTGVKRVVFASTAAAYGDAQELPIVETTTLSPLSFYGLSKVTVEHYLALYQEIFNLDYVVLRFANVYGERQGDGGEGGVISIFTKRIASGKSITIYGDGGQTRDFVYAGDIAAGIYCALQTDNVNTAYNLSTQTEVSVNAMVALFDEITGNHVVPLYERARKGDIYRSVLSNVKAITGLGWKPVMSLAEGLKRTYHSFNQQK
ncbi:UDP-glucose 4-epimerase [Propionispira arboris]|uniref:UDP-glucose 4-epimerase n=1 Tax=Propionispira arboris TaxID=84035 RepID=A0A1H6UDT7_9FIRM|nr:NAD-dependent epimerase/dehydratase family protein [Propionispira arboris]SEI86350.1 UDP-glucose 4-epimerase [Propionispira arboris]